MLKKAIASFSFEIQFEFVFDQVYFLESFPAFRDLKKTTKHLIKKILKYRKKTIIFLQSDLHYPKSSWLIVAPIYMFHKTYEAFHKKHFHEFM